MPTVPPLRPEAVRQVGLMISGMQSGTFRLLVKTIDALAYI
ncbi:MAG: CIA30 family protein [Rhodoferax sp.]|nr:CIA30 family protein [Rhodoferax sp.]